MSTALSQRPDPYSVSHQDATPFPDSAEPPKPPFPFTNWEWDEEISADWRLVLGPTLLESEVQGTHDGHTAGDGRGCEAVCDVFDYQDPRWSVVQGDIVTLSASFRVELVSISCLVNTLELPVDGFSAMMRDGARLSGEMKQRWTAPVPTQTKRLVLCLSNSMCAEVPLTGCSKR